MYKRDHEIMTSDYAQQLAQDISSMEAYIKNLYGNNVHYQILKRSPDHGKPVDACFFIT